MDESGVGTFSSIINYNKIKIKIIYMFLKTRQRPLPKKDHEHQNVQNPLRTCRNRRFYPHL